MTVTAQRTMFHTTRNAVPCTGMCDSIPVPSGPPSTMKIDAIPPNTTVHSIRMSALSRFLANFAFLGTS